MISAGHNGVNGSLDELLGLAPSEEREARATSSAPPRPARGVEPEGAEESSARRAAVEASLAELEARDRARRARRPRSTPRR